MAANILPAQAVLLQLLRYDAETGRLYWRNRSADWFSSAKSPEAARNVWNAQRAGKEAFGSKGSAGYPKGELLGMNVLAHRVIWVMHYGGDPNGIIDHIDQDRANNRIENLRLTDYSGNSKNQRLRHNSISGVIGVRWLANRKKWRADIYADGRDMFLGLFANKDEAVRVRKAAEAKYGFSENHGRSNGNP
jgi:hypothetical protein